MKEFRKEYIGGGISLFVSDEHTFGTDAVLLADFSAPSPKAVCCDLGSGCGIIPFIWCKKNGGKITAVEIQPQGIEQINAGIEYNGLTQRVEAVCTDLREIKGKLPFGAYNLVTMNPPYTAEGAGIISSSGADKIARHGTMCSFSDICFAASKLLNFGGRLCMCLHPERLCELMMQMKNNSIEPKRLRFVAKEPGKAPWLVLIEGKRGGKSGLKVEPELYIYGSDGKYSPEMNRIYGDYLPENRGENS